MKQIRSNPPDYGKHIKQTISERDLPWPPWHFCDQVAWVSPPSCMLQEEGICQELNVSMEAFFWHGDTGYVKQNARILHHLIMGIEQKVLVKNYHCEDRSCYVLNSRKVFCLQKKTSYFTSISQKLDIMGQSIIINYTQYNFWEIFAKGPWKLRKGGGESESAFWRGWHSKRYNIL